MQMVYNGYFYKNFVLFHAFAESLDSFYGLKLEVTRNKSYLDV
jgi:hypothetical protein